jgi:zinc protease
MNRDDLHRHYRTYYTPNNAIAVVIGDFDTQEMLNKIEHYFGSITPGPAIPPMRLQEPEQKAERRVILRGSDLTTYLIMSFHAPAATHPDFFPLMVMDAVLGGAKGMGLFGGSANNRSNRLYKALVDPQLAVAAQSSYQPTIDPDLFSFAATLAPGIDHAQVEAALWHEIAKVQQEGVTAAELQKAIKQTKAQFAYSSESVTNQAYWLGFSEILANTEWLDRWQENLVAVTAEDVQRVATTYFAQDKQTVGWYMPDLTQTDNDADDEAELL